MKGSAFAFTAGICPANPTLYLQDEASAYSCTDAFGMDAQNA
jgi:hypothetical protein